MTSLQEFIPFFGALAGALSISIAVYLQLMLKRRCRPSWVAAYLLTGTFLILLNLNITQVSTQLVYMGQIVVYGLIFVLEIAGVIKINKEMDKDNITIDMDSLVK